MKKILTILALLFFAACAVVPSAPENQIRDGASAVTAAATLTGSLFTLKKISLDQAKDYRALLGTASARLDGAFKELAACRSSTGSSSTSAPDPCRSTVERDIGLALSVIAEVKKTLDARQ